MNPSTACLLGQGIAAPPPFNPMSIPGGVLWLRADQGVTSSSGLVSRWADQSGVGDANHDAVQATGTAKPTLVAANAAFNNKPTINTRTVAGGPNTWMESGVWTTPLASPRTFFSAAQCTQPAGVTLTFPELWMDVGGNIGIFANFPAPGNLGAKPGVFDGISEIDGPAVWTSPAVVASVMDGVSSSLYVNSHLPFATGSLDGTTITQYFLGAADSGAATEKWNGPIAEIIVYNRILTGSEITQVVNYLGARYAITIA